MFNPIDDADVKLNTSETLSHIDELKQTIEEQENENEALKLRITQLETRCKYLLEGVDSKQSIVDKLSRKIEILEHIINAHRANFTEV